jgi:chemotaxis protein MotB
MMIRSRKQKKDNHDNSDRWLLTYADLITLLLGLFVILYAMSKVDSAKYAKVAQALGGTFGKEEGRSNKQAAKEGVLVGIVSPILQKPITERDDIEEKLHQALYEDLKSNLIDVTQDSRGVIVHITEELLFPSGSATLKNSSLSKLDRLGAMLAVLPNDIRVEGHTDDVPISTSMFPSNWHLSVARAMNTGGYLMGRHGIKPERVAIVGYSQYQPLLPNTSAENMAKNRRVDIVIITEKLVSQIQQQKEEVQ